MYNVAPPYKALIKTLFKVSLDVLANDLKNGVPHRLETLKRCLCISLF